MIKHVFKNLVVVFVSSICLTVISSFLIDKLYWKQIEDLVDDMHKGTFHLISERLKQYPEKEWPDRLSQLQSRFGYLLSLGHLKDISLESQEKELLQQGELVFRYEINLIDNDSHSYLSLIPESNYVLIFGPNQLPIVFDLYILIPLLLCFLVFAAAIFSWSMILRKKMSKLEKAVITFGKGNLSTRVKYNTRDETADLASTFNKMADQIEQLIESHKQLTYAVSHELRTPLSRFRFRIEMLLDKVDDQTKISITTGMKEDIVELDSLISELLDYTRLDKEPNKVSLQKIQIHQWMQDIIDQEKPLDSSIQIDLVSDSPANIKEVLLDPHLMARALGNILRNAYRYAQNRITITWGFNTEKQCIIHIDDDGPGIPAADRHNIFKPFVRLDKSRSRSSGGYGLGLSIADQIIKLHKSEIHVTGSPIGGARFSIILYVSANKIPAL